MAAIPAARPSHPSTAGVIPRIVVLALLVCAVAVIAALAGYTRGRASVDQDGLQAKSFAAGQLAGRNDARLDAARAAGAAALSPRPASIGSRSHLITGPSAEMRAQLRRAYAAGVASAGATARARGRALGAAAALGNFSGWADGGWYIVRLAPGGSQTGGRPTIASRLGPLSSGQGYMACRDGQAICPVGGATPQR